MAATQEDIEAWFDQGVSKGARYMIMICDTYDYTDYPIFCSSESEAVEKMKRPGEMQRVMECYDLKADKNTQMKANRAMALVVS